MTLAPEYLQYPARRHGMDHDRYAWSNLFQRKPVSWPGNARVALWVTVSLQWYPLDMQSKPVAPPGRLGRYPDHRNYSHRDYGLRVGVFRLMRLLDRLGIAASVPMNSAVAERHPSLVDEVNRRGWEVIGHGVHMGRMQHGGMDIARERELVQESLATLRRLTGQPVRGWLSIGKSESANTPEILAQEGVEYFCDWSNDDMPYRFATANGALWSLPHTQEIDDREMLVELRHREPEFVQQVKDGFETLYSESERVGGRIMSIALHPWVIGQPYRVRYLEEALRHILSHDGVWVANGAAILDAFAAQHPEG